MPQQFIRRAGLVISVGDTALDLSELRFTFQTQAWVLGTPANIYLRIYNMAPATAQRIREAGSQIQLSAGYEGNFATIFEGGITQVWIGRNGTDSYVDITALDGDTAYNQKILSLALAAGTNTLGRLGTIANALGMQLAKTGVPDDGPKLHRGRVYFGLARDHLDPLCGTIGANWTFHRNTLEVVAQNAYAPGDIPAINSGTGMVGVPEQTDLGIAVRCLLNPSIRQNMAVQLDNASIQQFQFPLGINETAYAGFIPPISADGRYKVLCVRHAGDTRGEDWFTDLVCYSGAFPAAAVAAGYAERIPT